MTEKIDIFYLYPTAWQKVNSSDPNICKIDNPSMLIGAPAAFARQATAFETVGNIYAPYYRQADGAYILALPLTEQHAFIAGMPTLDAVAAFDYYIKHFNSGRVFFRHQRLQLGHTYVTEPTGRERLPVIAGIDSIVVIP